MTWQLYGCRLSPGYPFNRSFKSLMFTNNVMLVHMQLFYVPSQVTNLFIFWNIQLNFTKAGTRYSAIICLVFKKNTQSIVPITICILLCCRATMVITFGEHKIQEYVTLSKYMWQSTWEAKSSSVPLELCLSYFSLDLQHQSSSSHITNVTDVSQDWWVKLSYKDTTFL